LWERVILPQINIEEVIFMKMAKRIFAVTLSLFLLIGVTNISLNPKKPGGGITIQESIDPPHE
jgi:hypothetical protein